MPNFHRPEPIGDPMDNVIDDAVLRAPSGWPRKPAAAAPAAFSPICPYRACASID